MELDLRAQAVVILGFIHNEIWALSAFDNLIIQMNWVGYIVYILQHIVIII